MRPRFFLQGGGALTDSMVVNSLVKEVAGTT